MGMFLDDATNQLSLTRVSSALVLLANFGYAAYAVHKTGVMPDIGSNWLMLVLALYGMNKASSTVKEIKIGGNTLSH